MATHIHVHLAPKKTVDRKVKDATPTDVEVRAYVQLRKDNDKLYAEIEKKEDQGVFVPRELRNKAEQGRQKENSIRTEIKQAARAKGWLDAAAPSSEIKASRANLLARLFGIPVSVAMKELEAEEWDEEEAANNLRANKK
jgi:hypothetical protein